MMAFSPYVGFIEISKKGKERENFVLLFGHTPHAALWATSGVTS